MRAGLGHGSITERSPYSWDERRMKRCCSCPMGAAAAGQVRAALLAQSRARRAGSGGTPGAATFIASLDHADGPRVRHIWEKGDTGPGCEACRRSRGLLSTLPISPCCAPGSSQGVPGVSARLGRRLCVAGWPLPVRLMAPACSCPCQAGVLAPGGVPAVSAARGGVRAAAAAAPGRARRAARGDAGGAAGRRAQPPRGPTGSGAGPGCAGRAGRAGQGAPLRNPVPSAAAAFLSQGVWGPGPGVAGGAAGRHAAPAGCRQRAVLHQAARSSPDVGVSRASVCLRPARVWRCRVVTRG